MWSHDNPECWNHYYQTMKFKREYFKTLMAAMAMCLLGAGCSSDRDELTGDNELLPDGYMKLVLNIHPLATRSVTDLSVTERIQSLRIIIIDADEDVIEENKLVTLNNGIEAHAVENFQYFYTFVTHTGNKQLILLANEESIGAVSYNETPDMTLPADLPTDITDLLDSYPAGSEADASVLYNVLNAAYFSPDYTIDENSDIYLPYVALYEEEITEPTPDQNSDTVTPQGIQWTTYMVPVAAKFTFIFNNFREHPVYVNEITLKNVNFDNYIMAHVGENDLYKNYDGEEYYWINWLAKVAQGSAGSTGSQNAAFNTQYGWISDYEMPTSKSEEKTFMEAAPDEEFGFAVDGAQVFNPEEGEIVPSTVTAGPFYVPESMNYLNVATGQTSASQIYFLTIALADTEEGALVPTFENVAIPNLGALFRDTSVLITLNFKRGDVEVFAEVADWNTEAANGWLEKGDAPDFLND